MKVVLGCFVALFVIVVSVPTQALEPLVLYDNFNTTLINPDKWFGAEVGADGCEVVRQIQGNRLLILNRAYGNTNSDSGFGHDLLGLYFANPDAVTAIEAKVKVESVKVIGCLNNPFSTQVEARLGGFFFNTNTPTPGSNLNDVHAEIRIVKRSNSTDPKNVFRAEFFVLQCNDAICSPSAATILDSQDLGPVKLGKKTRLRIQWDPDNDQFIFQRDGNTVFSLYLVSDTSPPGASSKALQVAPFVANCTVEPRPVAYIKASFDNVLVNESAAP